MWAGSFYDGVLRREQVDNRFIAVDKARQSSFRPEHAGLRNRAFGEVFDWIMLNAPSGSGEKALQNYRAVYLLGRFDATPALTAALRSFLGRGGIVVAQAAQLPLIPEEFRAIKGLRAITSSATERSPGCPRPPGRGQVVPLPGGANR